MSRRKSLFVIELDWGQSIQAAYNIRQAKATALREHGTRNVRRVRPATAEDVMWVKRMGGLVPDGVTR